VSLGRLRRADRSMRTVYQTNCPTRFRRYIWRRCRSSQTQTQYKPLPVATLLSRTAQDAWPVQRSTAERPNCGVRVFSDRSGLLENTLDSLAGAGGICVIPIGRSTDDFSSATPQSLAGFRCHRRRKSRQLDPGRQTGVTESTEGGYQMWGDST
jgi:hypothetical protein